MIKFKAIVVTTILTSLLMGTPVHAISTGAHATGHATTSAHPTTSTAHTSTSVTRSAGTTRSNTATTSKTVNTVSPSKTSTTGSTRTSTSAMRSTTYSSLTSSSQRSSYVVWRNSYGLNAVNEPIINQDMSHPCFWVPYWIMISNNDQINRERKIIIQTAHQHNKKWIKVGDKIVFVPNATFNKIKVGSHVTLVDNSHIKISEQEKILITKYIPVMCLTAIIITEIICKCGGDVIAGTLVLALMFGWNFTE